MDTVASPANSSGRPAETHQMPQRTLLVTLALIICAVIAVSLECIRWKRKTTSAGSAESERRPVLPKGKASTDTHSNSSIGLSRDTTPKRSYGTGQQQPSKAGPSRSTPLPAAHNGKQPERVGQAQQPRVTSALAFSTHDGGQASRLDHKDASSGHGAVSQAVHLQGKS